MFIYFSPYFAYLFIWGAFFASATLLSNFCDKFYRPIAFNLFLNFYLSDSACEKCFTCDGLDIIKNGRLSLHRE